MKESKKFTPAIAGHQEQKGVLKIGGIPFFSQSEDICIKPIPFLCVKNVSDLPSLKKPSRLFLVCPYLDQHHYPHRYINSIV